MSVVFLSYSRSDRALAEQIVRGLRAVGVDAWWDADMPGVKWQEELERRIGELDAVLCVWTENSLKSGYVRDEARLGLDTDKLVNAMLGVPKPPFPFDRINGLPLDGWDGRKPHKGWTLLVETVETLIVRAGGAKPGEITDALARREEEVRLRQAGIAHAQEAFQEAQGRSGEAAEAGKAGSDALDRAEEEQRRVVEMRAGTGIQRAALQELDEARTAKDKADRALLAAKSDLSVAARALTRAKAAFDALFAEGAEPLAEAAVATSPDALVTDRSRAERALIADPIEPPSTLASKPVAPMPPSLAVAAGHRFSRMRWPWFVLAVGASAAVVFGASVLVPKVKAYMDLHATMRAAAQGDRTSQWLLGFDYESGLDGLPQDYGQAMHWYQLSAAQGDAHAQYYIGNMYANGEGVAQDLNEARVWMTKAANQNDQVAKAWLDQHPP